MLGYQSTQNALHTRMIDFTIQEYLFVFQVVLGETPAAAYAMIYDEKEFKRNVPSENEEEYLSKFERDAAILLDQQQCKHLREYLESEYQSDIQEKAMTLEDFKFTGADVQKLLSNLLRNRSDNLDDASVKDILSLVKSMYESGALDSGDSFQKHFITIPNKYNALCVNCNREMYAVDGLNIRCEHCGQVYNWVENERRFYPDMGHL